MGTVDVGCSEAMATMEATAVEATGKWAIESVVEPVVEPAVEPAVEPVVELVAGWAGE